MTITAEAAQPPSIGRHGRFTDAERSHLADAQAVLPGGVMGSTRLPDDIALVFSHGKGPRFWDTSGNEYIDFGGGTPLGAIAGRADVMEQCDPRHKGEAGYVYQNGTLNGNPLSAAVALATLDELAGPGVYERLFEHCAALRGVITEVLERHSIPAVCFGTGPMWHILFAARPPRSHRDVMASDGAALVRLDHELIRQGLFVLPGTRRFVSTEHGDAEIEDTARALDRACRRFRS